MDRQLYSIKTTPNEQATGRYRDPAYTSTTLAYLDDAELTELKRRCAAGNVECDVEPIIPAVGLDETLGWGDFNQGGTCIGDTIKLMEDANG